MKSSYPTNIMVLIIPIIIISGCRKKPSEPSSEILPAHTIASRASLGNINVTLDVKANQTDKKQVTVKGKTNLPDGFIMTVGVCRYHFEREENSQHCLTTNSVNPSAQKVPVSKGQFAAIFTVPTVADLKSELIQYSQTFQDPLAAKHLPEEFITVSVIGTPLIQPPEILKVIGKDGENLQGKQTVRESFVTVEAEAKVKM